MRIDWLVKMLLLIIAVSLSAIAFRPWVTPPAVNAQAGESYPFYFEPGTVMLHAPEGSRQVYGRVAIDLRNGKTWGFPTTTQDGYPVNTMNSSPPLSHPFLLGRFARRHG